MVDTEAIEETGDSDDALTEREKELLDRIESYLGEHRDDLERRHWVQALGTLGLVGSGARELYRREVLEALPSARYRRETEEDGEHWEVSWHPSRETVPDAVSGVSGFAVQVALASTGGDRRSRDEPFLSIASAGASLLQAFDSGRRLVEELRQGDVDASTSIETIVSAATVPLVLPEAFRAVRQLLGR